MFSNWHFKLRGYIIYFLIIVGFFLFFRYWGLDKWFSNNMCREKDELIKNELFAGTVTQKFKDNRNHMHETIILQNRKKELVFFVPNEFSGFYDYIQTGDSISKPLNSLECTVFRDTLVKVFIIDFGCK